MRVPTFRSSMILATLTVAVSAGLVGPSAARAATCAAQHPNAVAIKIDCSACKAGTGGTCSIQSKSVEITVDSKPVQGKKFEVCWEVLNAPAGTVKISAQTGQSKDLKRLFKDTDFVFPSSQAVQTSGKARPGIFAKVKKNGTADWKYDIKLELNAQTSCKADPKVCVRENGGSACAP